MSKAVPAAATVPADYSLDVAIEAAARAIAAAPRLTALTGAGMSAESGINTFRDPEVGVWRNWLALALFGTPNGWRWTPGWAWSNYRRFHDPIFAAEPNDGHRALAAIGEAMQSSGAGTPTTTASATATSGYPLRVVTQNVDYLHQCGGVPDAFVHEVHGSVFRHRCIAKGHPMEIPQDAPLPASAPKCPQCGSRARPDAVLFTESLPGATWESAERAMRDLGPKDCCLVIGTSGSVYPAASLPGMCGRGVVKIEINADESGYTGGMDIFVKGPSAQCLPRILARVLELKAEE